MIYTRLARRRPARPRLSDQSKSTEAAGALTSRLPRQRVSGEAWGAGNGKARLAGERRARRTVSNPDDISSPPDKKNPIRAVSVGWQMRAATMNDAAVPPPP